MTVGVIGAGSWGVALAQLCAMGGEPTTLWARRAEAVDEIMQTRRSSYLPDVTLDAGIAATADAARLRGASVLLCVVPVQATRATLTELKPHLPEGCLLYTSPSPRDLSTSRMPSSA